MYVKSSRNGYSKEIGEKYVDQSKPLYFLSSFVEKQFEWENNQRTDTISGYRYWFVQDGVNPFRIKFKDELKEIPAILSEVKIPDLEGIEVKNKVYFKANKLEVDNEG